MKNNLIKRFVLLTLMFCGLSFSSQLQAQSTLGGAATNQPPAGPFVSPNQALQILQSNMIVVKEGMVGLGEGTQIYRDAYARYMSRSLVYDQVAAGKAIPESILETSLTLASDAYGVSKGKSQIYINEVIALLRP